MMRASIAVLAFGLLVAAGLFTFERVTGTSPVVRLGGLVWLPVDDGSPYVSKSVQAGLRADGVAVPGAINWRSAAQGFETAELPVLLNGEEVDRLLLVRFDPELFEISVRNDLRGRKGLDRWMRETGAAAIINGGYYDRQGLPATPSVIDGAALGPKAYEANHGAFVADEDGARLVDLAGLDWREVFAGADQAFVSYPLLLGADGESRIAAPSNWLANRSFIGKDRDGRIILGSTVDAYFSLKRFADFLGIAPLDLKLALNLDGGPVVGLAVRLGETSHRLKGRWEIQVEDGRAKMLPPLWMLSEGPMPIVLAVTARAEPDGR
ncbi:MAG: phosphodiester glycosidase family protein [Pseudomonadota bacterium]